MFALPAYASLSARIGRRPVMVAGCAAAIVAVYPILLLIGSGSVVGVLLGFLIAMPLVQAAMYGPLAAFTTEIFATGTATPARRWGTSCPRRSAAASLR